MQKKYLLPFLIVFFLVVGIGAKAQNFPIATNDFVTTSGNVPVTIFFLDNDSFGDDGPNTDPVSILSNPLHGVIELFNESIPNGPVVWSITYTPFLDFIGVDNFLYEIKDANGDGSTGTITISVQSSGIELLANPDYIQVLENTISPPISVIGNDTFGNGTITNLTIATTVNYGVLEINTNGTPENFYDDVFIYTPIQDFVGEDSFTYTVQDDFGNTSSATVFITVIQNQNEPNTPIATNDFSSTEVNTPIVINVLGNDFFGVDGAGNGSIIIASSPLHGSVIVNDSGTPNDPTDDILIYTPNTDYLGDDIFTYTISDANGDTATATVSILVLQSPNDLNVPTAVDDYATTSEDMPVMISVIANDLFGADGPSTSAIYIVSNSQNGYTFVNSNGTLDDPTDDTITYNPNANYNGVDSFAYSIVDGNGDISTATVFITIVPDTNTGDGPVALDDSASCNQNSSVQIEILINDSFGADGPNAGSIYVFTQPQFGVAFVDDNGTPTNPTDDTIVYTPIPNYFGNDSFTYGIENEYGISSAANVYVNVIQSNNSQNVSFVKTAELVGEGNVGDTVLYTFRVTNDTGGTISAISIVDEMLSNNVIGQFDGLLPGTIYTLNYPYTLTSSDVAAGFISNSALLFYTNFNGVTETTYSDDGDLTNGTDNPTITYLYSSPTAVIESIIQPSCSGTTGSIVLSNLPPGGWTIYYDGISIQSNYTIFTIDNLAIGGHNFNLVDLNNGLSQSLYVYIGPSVDLDAVVTSNYVDYNNDGFTNVGDVINYQYSVVNNGSCDLTNIGIYPTPFLNTDGATIPVLSPQVTDNTTLFVTHVITQEEINAGYVHLDSSLFYYAGTSTNGIEVINDTFLTTNSSFKLNAFIDANNNGMQEDNEVNFSDGYFTYQLNNGTINTIYSQNGVFYLYETDPNNLYNITYTLNDQFNQCTTQYVLNTASYSNVSLSNDGFQTINFAITDGVCNDLGVYLCNGFFLPRPGFNYYNSIYYTNNGNQTIPSGTITFTKDALLSITNVSEAAITNTANGFSYNFTNLLPYETRAIYVDMLVPLIPIINLGDTVTNSVAATTSVTENSLDNNISTITDIVIGSYDPNDKTESHGGKVLYSSFTADDYLTYTIRFENTGTAEAINVKVTDVLEQTLDETSIRMVAASDDYVLERVGSNLTWTFSGINLVPSVENTQIGHGFITFQVKPKPGFVLGDEIANTASIYFDFNPAIVTNTFTTEFVVQLGTEDFASNDFIFYPNPVKDNLSLSHTEKIDYVTVYSLLGQKVFEAAPQALQTELDLSGLSNGTYLLKVKSENKEKTIRFIKE